MRTSAHVAYAPGSRVAGFGAIPRVIGILAARPQTQEALGVQIARTLQAELDARSARGVRGEPRLPRGSGPRESAALARTVAACGVMEDRLFRAEVLALLGIAMG